MYSEVNSSAVRSTSRAGYIYRRPVERSNFLGSWISRLVSRIRSFSIATTGIPEDRSFSPSFSPPVPFSPSAVLQDDATVVRKRRATEDDRRFRRDKWRVSGGYFDSGTIALGNDRPPSLTVPFPLSPSPLHGRLLISWLKMSDTRTTERVHPPAGSQEKNNRAHEGTTDKTREGKRSSTRDPGLKSLYEAPARILDRSYFPPRTLRAGIFPAITPTPRVHSPCRPIFPPVFDHK